MVVFEGMGVSFNKGTSGVEVVSGMLRERVLCRIMAMGLFST